LQLIWHIPIKRPRGWGSLARVTEYHTSNGTLTWAWFTDTLQIKAMDALDMYIVHIYIHTCTYIRILEQFCQGCSHTYSGQPDVPFKQIRKKYHDNIYICTVYIYIYTYVYTYIHTYRHRYISNKYAPSGAQPDQMGSQGARSIVPAALVTWCHVSRCNLRLWINSYKYHVYAMFICFLFHRHSVLHVGIEWYSSMVWASLISSIHPRTGNGLYWCIILLLAVGDWLIQLHGGNPPWDMLWDSLG
jgi:hypothetical protein